jgi:hypothetical protein
MKSSICIVKKLFLSTLLLLATVSGFAQQDTVVVRSHDHTHWNWYGNWNNWTVFPGDTFQCRKVLLAYTLGCPGSGCSEWDYTTQIKVLHRTGLQDSVLNQAPWLVVNGNSPDSLQVLMAAPYITFFNAGTMLTDSALAQPDSVFVYGDAGNPLQVTDTVMAYQGGYWNYYYNGAGTMIDSAWIGNDSIWYNGTWSWYSYSEQVVPIELARFITPYAGSVNNSWSRTVYFDVTDYRGILTDSTEVQAHYGGWQDGFTITLDFIFIEGMPPRNVLEIIPLYDGAFNYGTTNSIENYLVPVTVTPPAGTQGAALHFTPTGHGFNNNEDCAEFCPKEYYIKADGVQVDDGLIWKDDCGWNPMFPQSGTWLYDRANWCPGDKGRRFEHDLTPFLNLSQSFSLDIDMQPYTWNGSGGVPSYIMHANVIAYGPFNHSLDAEIQDIMAPNSYYEYRRMNPICDNVRVQIRNSGGTPITSLHFEYGVQGGLPYHYNWTGTLAPMESAEIDLPLPDPSYWNGPTDNFTVTLSQPNGGTDQVSANNSLTVPFERTPAFASPGVVVLFKTNSAPNESAYSIEDASGNIVFQKTSFAANFIHKDTIPLAPGCYTLKVSDTEKDGLTFWANSDGSGYFRLQRYDGIIYQSFSGDFGAGVDYSFTIGYGLGDEPRLQELDASVFPVPANSAIHVVPTQALQQAEVQLIDINGAMVFRQEYQQASEYLIPVQSLPAGIYTVRLLADGMAMARRVVIVH